MILKLFKYFLILNICFNLLLWGTPTCTIIRDENNIPILTPSLAQRETLKLRLSNGLEAYLISDPMTTQAGAVLTVQAGSWDDPKEHPGIAHFVEHMLFLGTEKYPIESEYDHFIRLHHGNSNAYTASDYTLYLFSINPSYFEEALDRFSSFFKKPLFNPSGTEREIKAIDQEFAKNFNQDGFRVHYVQKELANPEHPFHQFSIGNSQSLSNVTQEVLRKWYEDHYSADLMRVIIFGPQSIETLKSWVEEDFKEIPSSGQTKKVLPEKVLSENMQGKILYINPVKNMRALQVTWEFPLSMISQSAFKPQKFMGLLLSDEGKGSLSSILKEEGFAENVTANGFNMGKNNLIFSIEINLTQEGLEKISVVMDRCFQKINSLKQQELPPYLFEELKKIQTTSYQYQSRKNVFSNLMDLGGLLIYEDLKNFPEGALISQEYDAKAVHEFLNYLSPQNAHFTVLARHPVGIQFDQREKWIGVPYNVVPLSSEQMNWLQHLPPNPKYQLPSPNPFIPQNFQLVNQFLKDQRHEALPEPTLLINDEQSKIYFAPDDRYELPHTMWFFEIKSPLIEQNNPKNTVLLDLYIKSLEEKLQPYSYPAEVANLSYNISRSNDGILITCSGYRDTLETLFASILTHLKNCHPTESMFNNFKNVLLGKYYGLSQDGALDQGFDFYQNILYESHVTQPELAEAIKKVSYGEFSAYVDHLYDQTFINGFLYGNVNQQDVLHLSSKLKDTLDSQVFHYKKKQDLPLLALPNQVGPYLIDVQIQSPSHALILGIEESQFSFKNLAAQQILSQAMDSAFYSTLRTKQQTCYLLFTHSEELDKHLFTFFGLQSTTHDPRDLLARVELFIENFLADMENHELTQERFEQIKQMQINTLQYAPGNLNDMGNMLKNLAFNYDGDFNWDQKRIEGLKELTYEDFLDFARNFLGKQNKHRLALLIRGTTDTDFHYNSISNLQKTRESQSTTSSLT